MTYEITKSAERDIKGVLAETLKYFGTRQLAVYAEIIGKGIKMVTDNPDRAGSFDQSEIAAEVKLFHLELAAGRRGAAAHCLHYTTGMTSSGAIGTIVLRRLHENMEPRYKVIRSLNNFIAQRSKGDPAET